MKFKERKIGRLLTSPIVKSLIGFIPFGIGSAASNILNKVNDSEEGQIDSKSIYIDLIKIAIYGVLGYLVMSGKISIEDIEIIKDIISTE